MFVYRGDRDMTDAPVKRLFPIMNQISNLSPMDQK